MNITFTQTGNFKNIDKALITYENINSKVNAIFKRYGDEGIKVLSENTPVATGVTAESWTYRLIKTKGGYELGWYNSNIVNGTPLVIMIHYGHATRNGGFVKGRDYINPAIAPIFDKIVLDIWREVSAL